MDQGVAQYSVAACVRTKCWYITPTMFLMDIVANNIWQVAQCHIQSAVSTSTTNYYSQFRVGPSRNDRERFQVTLGRDLILYATKLRASDPAYRTHESWTPCRIMTATYYADYMAALGELATLRKLISEQG